jgi:hypothetical protein
VSVCALFHSLNIKHAISICNWQFARL